MANYCLHCWKLKMVSLTFKWSRLLHLPHSVFCLRHQSSALHMKESAIHLPMHKCGAHYIESRKLLKKIVSIRKQSTISPFTMWSMTKERGNRWYDRMHRLKVRSYHLSLCHANVRRDHLESIIGRTKWCVYGNGFNQISLTHAPVRVRS